MNQAFGRRPAFISSKPAILIAFSLLFQSHSGAVPQQRPTGSNVRQTQSENSTHRRFISALEAYKAQQYETAQEELEALVRAAPGSFEVNELLGIVYVAQGKQERATPFLSKAVQLNPNVVEARTALATNLLAIHRVAEAELQFKKAVALKPRSYDTNHNLGEFYVQTGKISAAIPFLKRAQEIDPANYNNGYDLVLAYEGSNQLDEARKWLRSLMRFHDSAELHGLMAEIEEKSRNYLQAAAQYEQAARLEPSETNLLNWGAELLLHQTFEPAIQVFNAGLTRYPQSPRLQSGLGIAFYGMGHFDEAARAFLRAADLNPLDPLPLTFLGKSYGNLSGEIGTEVRDRLKSYIDRHPGNAAITYYYAMCLFRQNQVQKDPELTARIEALLKSALALDPNFADAHLQLGVIYSDQQKYGDAVEQYGEALKTTPNSASTHYRLGQALAKSGETERAKQEFALFERLRQTEVEESSKERNQIQQFVYSIRKSDEGNQN